MKRDLIQQLNEWRIDPLRKPLILRGARQVGKSWLVEEFAKSFPSFVKINFEKQSEAISFFEGDIDIPLLLEKLQLYIGKKIIPGETLLFLDEIQICERAIIALRYFKEELPNLHIIAAGSLIDFTLKNIGMPVGRVQFLYLHPLSFGEFLTAQGKQELRDYLNRSDIDPVLHEKALEDVKTYFWLGGMPAVVSAWLAHRDLQACLDLQDEIILTYKQDFEKYTKGRLIDKVETVFNSVPEHLGEKFVYNKIDSDLRAYVFKEALDCLKKAGIIHIVYHSSGQGVPLAAGKDNKRFKVFFFDIGLAQRILGLDLKQWVTTPLNVKHAGAMAEQFVAQEYIAYSSIKQPSELYYWHREERSSNAEVDFLFLINGQIIPVEVKSGKSGTLKSLQMFLSLHNHSTWGVKISEQAFSNHHPIISVPFYGIERFTLHKASLTVT